MSRIEELKVILKEAKEAYYNSADSSLTDAEFDELENELRSLSPEDEYFKMIGSSVSASEWKKATHKIAMCSLNKVNLESEFLKWCEDNSVDIVCLQDKLDGSSIDLEYKDGELIKAITRGDGLVGEDIYCNVCEMKNVKKTIKDFSGSIRGEIFLLAEDFEKLNNKLRSEGKKELSNPRNGATGIAKRYDGSNSEYLTVYFYDIVSNDIEFEYESDKLQYLKSIGLKVCHYEVFTIQDAIEMYNNYEESLRAKTPYDIDGLVIKLNDIKKQKALGNLGSNPKGQIAWKFTSMKVETVLEDIEWSLGNRRVTPVAIVKSILCGGVHITHATLHNIDRFLSLKLGKGDIVQISRRGDVIPALEKVIEHKGNKFEIPTTCPSCGSDLKVDNKFLICPNDSCDGLAIRNLRKWIDKLEIMDVGESTIEALYNSQKVSEPSDFYKLSIEDITSLEGFGVKSAKKILDHLNEKKAIELPIFIAALNMTDFSTSTAELLVENGYDSLEKMFEVSIQDLVAIKGIETKTASQIIKGLKEKKSIISNLLDVGITIKSKEKKMKAKGGSLKGKSFVFTGKIEKTDENGDRYTRDMMTEIVLENGGEVLDSVRKGLSYLVQADPSSQSTKTKKALQLGVEILSESDFFKMI